MTGPQADFLPFGGKIGTVSKIISGNSFPPCHLAIARIQSPADVVIFIIHLKAPVCPRFLMNRLLIVSVAALASGCQSRLPEYYCYPSEGYRMMMVPMTSCPSTIAIPDLEATAQPVINEPFAKTIDESQIKNHKISGLNAVKLKGALEAAVKTAGYVVKRQSVHDDTASLTLELVKGDGGTFIEYIVNAEILVNHKQVNIQIYHRILSANKVDLPGASVAKGELDRIMKKIVSAFSNA